MFLSSSNKTTILVTVVEISLNFKLVSKIGHGKKWDRWQPSLCDNPENFWQCCWPKSARFPSFLNKQSCRKNICPQASTTVWPIRDYSSTVFKYRGIWSPAFGLRNDLGLTASVMLVKFCKFVKLPSQRKLWDVLRIPTKKIGFQEKTFW